jgi:hypothetical protein
VDTGVGTSYEVLIGFDDTSKKILKDAIEFYDTTRPGELDFALESFGSLIVSTSNTNDHESSQFGTWARSAQHIIQACVVPGECWAFEGSGAAVIQLTGEVKITEVSI